MVDTSTESQEPFDSLLEALEEAHPQLNTRKGVALTTLASKLYFDYRWPTFKNGAPGSHKIPILEVLHYNAPALLATLDSKKWQGEFWDWLNQVSKVKLKLEALKPSDLPWKVLRRKKIARTSTAKFPPLTSPIIATPDDEDQDEANEFETPRRLGKGVKTPARQGKSTLRPVASAHKRDYEDMDDDSDEESPVTKRAHHDAAHDVVREYKAGSSDEEEEIKLVIRADKLPSDVPQGKDGTWSCAEDDCDYVVRGGDAESCQQHIEAHFKDHEKQGERVQLAVTEGTRGHLPIKYVYLSPSRIRAQLHESETPVGAQTSTVFRQPPSPSSAQSQTSTKATVRLFRCQQANASLLVTCSRKSRSSEKRPRLGRRGNRHSTLMVKFHQSLSRESCWYEKRRKPRASTGISGIPHPGGFPSGIRQQQLLLEPERYGRLALGHGQS